MRALWMALASLPLTAALAQDAPLREPSTGVAFPPEQQAEGTEYECVGTGVRKVFLFKAYALAFCLEQGSADEALGSYAEARHKGLQGNALVEALQQDADFYRQLGEGRGERMVVMRAVRDIPRDKMAEAFTESLSRVLPPEKVAKVVAAIPGDIRKGQTARLFSHDGAVTIEIGDRSQVIDDPEVAQKLWTVWLGGKSVTPALRQSLARAAAARAGGS